MSASVAWGAMRFSRNSSEPSGSLSKSAQNAVGRGAVDRRGVVGVDRRSSSATAFRFLRSPCSTRDDLAHVVLLRLDLRVELRRSAPPVRRPAACGTRSRSLASARSMVLPEVTSAPLMPIGTTALTFGTVSSVSRTLAKSSSGARSGVAHGHAAHDLELVLGLGRVDLDVAGDAADDAAAHRRVDAVEQRAADHDQQRAEEDDAADDEGLEPAGEQVAEGDLRDRPRRCRCSRVSRRSAPWSAGALAAWTPASLR